MSSTVKALNEELAYLETHLTNELEKPEAIQDTGIIKRIEARKADIMEVIDAESQKTAQKAEEDKTLESASKTALTQLLAKMKALAAEFEHLAQNGHPTIKARCMELTTQLKTH